MKANIKNNIIMASALLALHANSIAAAGPPPGNTWAIGDLVQTCRTAHVWVTPPTAGEYAGEQPANASGRVIDGPVRAVDTLWWKVDFDTANDGWVSQRELRKAGSIATPPAPPPPVPTSAAKVLQFSNVTPNPGSVVNSPQIMVKGRLSHDVYPASLIDARINNARLLLDEQGGFAAKVDLAAGKNTITLRASVANPRQQTTKISAFIDGSMIYGSDSTRANALRSFRGGALKTSVGNLPPLNADGLENANDAHLFPDADLFLAGDVRANENLELTSIHALFVREHNQLAAAIAAANPRMNDEQIYQSARKTVIAEVQAITWREFLPALIGADALRPYAGYNPQVNAGLATEFSTAAFRVGHTMINDDVEFMDNDAAEIRDGLPLAFAFFNPQPLKEVGPDPVLKYLATDVAREVDNQLVDGLRDFLFGPPGAGGLDLASLNIQRGRDHGIADYNTVRRAYGLPVVTGFHQITSNPVLQDKLRVLYGDVDALDLWVAGLAEDHQPGSSVGETFQRIIANQFERSRDGDRFWYERVFSGRQLEVIHGTRLSDLIRRNTGITKLQDNVFFFDEENTLAGLVAKSGFLPRELIMPSGPPTPPEPLDGKGNNQSHPGWGVAGADLLRLAPADYGDGVATPAGSDRPGARVISNAVAVQTTAAANDRAMSSWVYGWGQFIDHDLGLTTTGDEDFSIPVPAGDPSFDPFSTGTEVIPLSRSNYNPATGTTTPTAAECKLDITMKPARAK